MEPSGVPALLRSPDCNATLNCCVFKAEVLDLALPPILGLEFIFGLLGNGVVLWTFMVKMKAWKPNSVYLIHLAVADSVMLFCLPVRADYYRRGKDWIHGDVLCRVLLFLTGANRLAGIFFLTAAAVDRYLKIVHPRCKLNQMGLRYAQGVSCSIWVLIVAMTHLLLRKRHFFEKANVTQCESFNICMDFDYIYLWYNTLYVIEFFVPATFITYSTVRIAWQLKSKMDTRGKIKRAAQFILAMALVFIICFFPSSACRIAMFLQKFRYNECSHFRMVNQAFYASLCLTYFNSALNPFIYYFSSPTYSRSFQKVFSRLLHREGSLEKVTPNSKNQSTTSKQTTDKMEVLTTNKSLLATETPKKTQTTEKNQSKNNNSQTTDGNQSANNGQTTEYNQSTNNDQIAEASQSANNYRTFDNDQDTNINQIIDENQSTNSKQTTEGNHSVSNSKTIDGNQDTENNQTTDDNESTNNDQSTENNKIANENIMNHNNGSNNDQSDSR